MTEGSGAATGPTCRCGFGRGHLMVSEDYRYTWWQAALVYVFGVSYPPQSIDLRCRVCRTVFDRVTLTGDDVDPVVG